MASGRFSSTTGVQFNIICEWESISDVNTNSSNITLTAYLEYYPHLTMRSKTLNFYCDGESKSIITKSIDDRGKGKKYINLGSRNFTVYHEPNGKKQVKLGVSIPELGITYTKYLPSIHLVEYVTLDTLLTPSKITSIGDFDVEGEHWLHYQKFFDNAYMDLYIVAWRDGNEQNKVFIDSGYPNWSGYRGDYKSGEHTKFDPNQLARIYSLAMPYTNVECKLNFTYILVTHNGKGKPEVGRHECTVKGTIKGNLRANINGTWKKCVPFVKANNVWRPCISLIKTYEGWKEVHPY